MRPVRPLFHAAIRSTPIPCALAFIALCCAAQTVEKKTPIASRQFDQIGSLSDGLAVVRLKKKFGYIDQGGRLVIPLQFADAAPFSEGLALVYTSLGINLFGKTEGVWLFATAGYIDNSGKFVIEPRLIEGARSFSEGLAAFEPGASSWGSAKWGYLDKTGKWAIKPQFDNAGDFSEGLAPVAIVVDKKSKREKWGYIDQTGKLRIPAEFDTAQAFRQGIARVFISEHDAKFEHMHRPKGRWWGCVNKNGEIVDCPDRAAKGQTPVN